MDKLFFQIVSRMILIKPAMKMVPLKCEFSIINGTLDRLEGGS